MLSYYVVQLQPYCSKVYENEKIYGGIIILFTVIYNIIIVIMVSMTNAIDPLLQTKAARWCYGSAISASKSQ